MKTFIQAYFDYYNDPAEVVHSLVHERRFGAALLGYFVAALCWVCFFWMGDNLTFWGFVWRFLFFWLLEITLGYLWAALSGLFLNFISHENGSSALFISIGLSGFVQSILLCFSLWSAVFHPLTVLTALVVMITLILRFSFAVLNTARAGQVGLGQALGAMFFVLIPAAAAFCLFIGSIILLFTLAA